MKKRAATMILVVILAMGAGCKSALHTWIHLTPEQLEEGARKVHARRAGRAIRNVARDGCSCENK